MSSISLSGDIFDQQREVGQKDIDLTGLEIGLGFRLNDYRNSFGYRYTTSKTTTDNNFAGTSTSGEEGIEIETIPWINDKEN